MNKTFIRTLLNNIAAKSPCQKRKVGCFIRCINCKSILSIGYNKGFYNKCEDLNNNTKSDVIHAECMAILTMKECNCNSKKAIFITELPCAHCLHMIYMKGLVKLYYIKDNPRPKKYRDKILQSLKNKLTIKRI